FANGGNQNIPFPGDLWKVFRLGMADCDRSIVVEQKHRNRFADNITPANHDSIAAFNRNIAATKDFNHASWRTWNKPRSLRGEVANIHGMKAIDILLRGNRQQNLF